MRRALPIAALALVAACCAGAKAQAASTLTPAQRLGFPALKPGLVPGYVMIADRNNNRIIIVNPRTNAVVWEFPRPGDVLPGQSFHDPDDAFFTPGYKTISTNEEYNQQIGEIDVETHRIVWSFGHAGVAGSAFGYLDSPDDAYLLPNGLFMVADIRNCRVLFVNRAHKVVREIGHAGNCGHNPPQSLSSPNGATPLADGGVLVTEIGGWVDRISTTGKLAWTIRTPTSYPSDAQPLPNGDVLVAGFNTPGRVDEITPRGKVVWTYAPTGYWSLDRPSLAVRWPNGLIAITDDWHHRVVVIDPKTKRVVWSYGHLGRPGSSAGYVNKPDGLDLLPATARGAGTGLVRQAPARLGTVARIGSLPHAISKAAAVALPGGKLMLLGGEIAGASTAQVLLGTPGRLRAAGRLPAPTHDAAAALVHGAVYLFGGGQATSVATVFRVGPALGAVATAGSMDEPLSDLGAVTVGGRAYLVGGYTSAKFASAVLRYGGGGRTTTVARLPAGTRYAGVAAIGSTIYVAGGLTPSGATSAVVAVDLAAGTANQVATLPAPEDHAAMAALGGRLYLVGGTRILRIDPGSGTVSVAGRLPVTLADPTATTVGSRVVIAGGGTSAVYAFTP